MWAGPKKHFLVFPVRHGTMVNYVGFVPADEEMKESWSAPGDPAVLHREFDGWDPRIGQVLKQVERTFRWALYDREPLPTWTRGRLTLLGARKHGLRVDSMVDDLKKRDADLLAHAEFRKQLYSYDVVPAARAAAEAA